MVSGAMTDSVTCEDGFAEGGECGGLGVINIDYDHENQNNGTVVQRISSRRSQRLKDSRVDDVQIAEST
ncbi:hypothetical protein Scep_007290 [Stephania cephalantha]|uniref:Uncharacterized protein n=1 Tax=Stephania cephalantha TaxID=152367 RepID=A0AAP0KBC2_9MAGN